MDVKRKITWFLTLLLLILVIQTTAGCVPPVKAAKGIPASGAGDLYYLSLAINDQSAKETSVQPVNMTVSTDSINDLKKGRADIAFLGRDPTAEELVGLDDYVIAYDAVCIIIDEHTYVGGVSDAAGHPDTKVTGLQTLTVDDVKQIFSGNGWQWKEGYSSFNPMIDPGSWLWTVPEIAWIPEPKPVGSSFIFPPGKFDTQTVLYQQLGLDEESMTANLNSFTSSRFDKEEEVLSYEYTGSAFSANYGQQSFAFKLGFASRRVMTVAPQHVPVRVIAVNGINPLENPQSVYDGTYPFCRKIHLLIRQNGPATAKQLAEYMKSTEGQKLINEAGYLPISQSF